MKAEPRSETLSSPPPASQSRIDLVISDVDGTLVTPDKVLTPRARDAIARLGQAGIGFTIISARPPRGLSGLVREAGLSLPFGGFNGGSLAMPDQSLIETHRLDPDVARQALSLLAERGVEAWVFADGDWRLLHPYGPEVAREAHTVGFAPTVVDGFDDVISRIDKIVGASSDFEALDRVEAEVKAGIGAKATVIRSNPAYLDVTHPLANKGDGVTALCRGIGVDLAHTAVIGDMFNDVAMFDRAGFSIAMGQAPAAVKTKAKAVTGANTDDGFALAMERFILDRRDP